VPARTPLIGTRPALIVLLKSGVRPACVGALVQDIIAIRIASKAVATGGVASRCKETPELTDRDLEPPDRYRRRQSHFALRAFIIITSFFARG
jgi:hypothetical protein